MSRLLIQFTNIFKSFGTSLLFDNISMSINGGDVFALIGENGSGKTTLLKLLTAEVLPDAGKIMRSPGVTLSYLPQEISTNLHLRAREYLEDSALIQLEQKMNACLEDTARLAEWADLYEKYEHLGGYRQIPAEKILHGLKLEATLLDLPMKVLSSGQRVRMALAKALIQNPDLLLLDEPTNHLDKEMLEWLKDALRSREGATVIISHDRKFLNAACNRLLELKQGKLACYGGNYDYYLAEQKHILQRQLKAYEEQKEEKAQLKQKIKALTFSKAKSSPPRDKNIMAYDGRGEQHQKSLQRNLTDLKAKLDAIENNLLPHPLPKGITGIRFQQVPLNSAYVIELEGITKIFDGKVLFSNFTKTLKKGDRVVLSGPNGSGKTTLLRMIAGFMSVDTGLIRYAQSAKIAYLNQEIEQLPMENSPLEYFKSTYNFSEEDLRCELHKAALGTADLLKRPFFTLSVGQRKRLMLLALILEKPNVLLLDEPTNHLDMVTMEAFEQALLNFEGTILAVSHDATFIEKIATQEWTMGSLKRNCSRINLH